MVQSAQSRKERFVRNWRSLIALILVARILNKFSYSLIELSELDTAKLRPTDVAPIWDVIESVQNAYKTALEAGGEKRSGKSLFKEYCEAAAAQFGLSGTEQIGRRAVNGTELEPSSGSTSPLTTEFVDAVNAILPDQPWKPRIHVAIASALGSESHQVSAAIQQLIAKGKRYVQRDGVVYDAEGKVLMVDSEAILQFIAEGKRHVQKDGIIYDSEGNVLMVSSERVRLSDGSHT